ncbi:hypothetical protein AB0E10_40925 [Streptomyces sp. NPDC048045]|uniref:hypothetical protein n=1 Tax=Streptomyces sp. NPDC048045 TaxID=3154710 RepID=UPI00343E8F39
MSHIAYGGADFGEVVSTRRRIVEGDYDSRHQEWPATADRAAAEDEFFKCRPEQLYDPLTCPKTLMVFTVEEGAGAHCHPGATQLSLTGSDTGRGPCKVDADQHPNPARMLRHHTPWRPRSRDITNG